MKYDKMVAINQEKSKKNAAIAKREINKMREQGKRIIVAELVKNTGFSSTFFYNNQEVRKALEDAKKWQEDCLSPNRIPVDPTLKDKLFNAQIEIIKLKSKVMKLTEENQELVRKIEMLKLSNEE